MNFLSLVGVEFKKIKRSKILLILLVATVILWIPSIVNAKMNFDMQAEGISPENNFFIQGFMGMSWFMFPASMVVGTVLLSQTERANKGILKMLSLPISTAKLCMAKFIVLLALAALQIGMAVGMYYVSAAIASSTQNYNFILQPLFVFKEAGLIFVAAIPMLAFFWLLYSDTDFFYRYRIGFDYTVRIDDQYKSVVCLSDVVSVLCDNGRIRKTCSKF